MPRNIAFADYKKEAADQYILPLIRKMLNTAKPGDNL